jgi:hypothetical protein
VNTRIAAVAAALALLALTGCTSIRWSDDPPPEALPPASAFLAGACASAADPTLALARLAHRNRKAKKLPDADRAELRTRQDGLVALQPSAEGDLKEPLEQLIVAIGFVRLRSDGNKYDRTLLGDLDDARRKVQSVCVAG